MNAQAAQTTKLENTTIVGMMETPNTHPAHYAFPQYKADVDGSIIHISYCDVENDTIRIELDKASAEEMLGCPWTTVPEEAKPILQEIILHPKLIWAKNHWVDSIKGTRLNEILLASLEEYDVLNKLPKPVLSKNDTTVTLSSQKMSTEISAYHNGEVWHVKAIQHVIGGDDMRFIRLTNELFNLLVTELVGFDHLYNVVIYPVKDDLRQMN